MTGAVWKGSAMGLTVFVLDVRRTLIWHVARCGTGLASARLRIATSGQA